MCWVHRIVRKGVKPDDGSGRTRRARLQGRQVDDQERVGRNCEGAGGGVACVCGSGSSQKRDRSCI